MQNKAHPCCACHTQLFSSLQTKATFQVAYAFDEWCPKWLQVCATYEEAEGNVYKTRKALQTHMEFDAEQGDETDYK